MAFIRAVTAGEVMRYSAIKNQSPHRFAPKRRKDGRARAQRGFSLIELMVAGALLVIGALAVVGMISIAIATNSRNRIDSTKTMLAQAVIEQVSSTLIGSGQANLTDCAGNNFSINATTG